MDYRMTVSKTRLKLVDVARQLFAKMGVQNTTMNDIALASKKGRRTLYTYFKNKDEIYSAVIETELERLFDVMTNVASEALSPDEKLVKMIFARLDAIKEIVYRNGTLRAYFFRDIWKVEKARKKFDNKEVALIRNILAEGIQKGIFKIDDLDMTAMIIHYCVKGVEVPYIRGRIGSSFDTETSKKYVSNLVLEGLKRNISNE
jgi:AcrR family transcriptional regulator